MPTTTARALFAGTIFASAFLLFLVQPLIAKQILPWFGGSAAVWSICMVFFQCLLLAGYAYSDQLVRRFTQRAQARLHAALLLASLAALPIVASPRWQPAGHEEPTLWILGLLLATVGLPYFLLCTTGPLLQAWLSGTALAAGLGRQVYRYFSLSNLASLASLLCYPVLIEPHFALLPQAWGWSAGYAAFVLLGCGVAWQLAHAPAAAAVPVAAAPAPPAAPADGEGPPGAARQLLWLSLPALGSWLLLGVTNHLTQNVAAIPFLWVLPLVVYLLTFVLCFEGDRWYRRRVWLPLAAASLLLCAWGLQDSLGSRLQTALPIYVGGLFLLCMALHGEMARDRPGPRWLTRFYLMLACGGALGGIAVGLVAPRVLSGYYELGIGLALSALAGTAVLWRQVPARLAGLALALACLAGLAVQVHDDRLDTRLLQRNFYGTLSTLDAHRDDPADDVRQMYHGSVKHGEQYLAAARRREPTTYYGASAGIGRALRAAMDGVPQRPLRVGLIGLGAGTLAAYGRAGDVYRVYEINPQVFDAAEREFSFLRDSPATIEQVLGDARLALEREPAQRFDVLAVDAFSGDSVPIHLITTQALAVYERHLAPGGVIAFHVTNRFLNLAPVVRQIAMARGLQAMLVHDEAEDSDLRRTDWVLVARDAAALERPGLHGAGSAFPVVPGLRAWTDDFNNLFGVLR